jgi:hypothetical protein
MRFRHGWREPTPLRLHKVVEPLTQRVLIGVGVGRINNALEPRLRVRHGLPCCVALSPRLLAPQNAPANAVTHAGIASSLGPDEPEIITSDTGPAATTI